MLVVIIINPGKALRGKDKVMHGSCLFFVGYLF